MKSLPFSAQTLRPILEQHPTPFHIYEEAGIVRCVQALHDAFSWNKGFREYFAVKALPNPYILQLLRELGCGVDCASSTELQLSQAVGCTGEDIFFSANNVPTSEFAHARRMGAIINLDDPTHIQTLEQAGPLPDTICCRYNPGGAFALSGNQIMGELHESKFGMTKAQLFDAFATLRQKGVRRFGIHALLVSCAMDPDYYPQLAAHLFSLAVELKQTLGISLSFINLSGGLGIPYRPDEQPLDIYQVSAGVKAAYDAILVPADLGELSLYTELGRYITGPYGFLVSTVLHKKESHKRYLGLDSSACDLMRPAIYGAYHHITVLGKEDAAANECFDVTGSLCENNDKFAVDRALPPVEIGDVLVIHDTGAHGHAMGYNYNGKLRCAELLLRRDGTVQQIRRAERPSDYFSTLDQTPFFSKLDTSEA